MIIARDKNKCRPQEATRRTTGLAQAGEKPLQTDSRTGKVLWPHQGRERQAANVKVKVKGAFAPIIYVESLKKQKLNS